MSVSTQYTGAVVIPLKTSKFIWDNRYISYYLKGMAIVWWLETVSYCKHIKEDRSSIQNPFYLSMECTMYLYCIYLLYKMELNVVKPWFRAQDSELQNAQNRQNIWKQSAEALRSMYSTSRPQCQIQAVHSRSQCDSWRGFCPEALLAG